MSDRQRQVKTAAGAALWLAGAFSSAEAATENHLHAAPDVRQEIGATADFLEQAGRKHGTHVFLYRCSYLGIGRDAPLYTPPLELAQENFLTAFPEAANFISVYTPDPELIDSEFHDMMDHLVHPRCYADYNLGHMKTEGQRAVFIGIPENFAEENLDSFSLLPARYYRSNLPEFLPVTIDWMLRHEFDHYLRQLKNTPCRSGPGKVCAMEDEGSVDISSTRKMSPEQRQRIADTRAMGALHGSSADHNTGPFLTGSRRNYRDFYKGSVEAIEALHAVIRTSLLDEQSHPVLYQDMPEPLMTALGNCVVSFDAEVKISKHVDMIPPKKEKYMPSCVIGAEPRVVPAAAARIDPQTLSREGQTYLVDYFKALGREAKPEFYENEIADYIRGRFSLEIAPP